MPTQTTFGHTDSEGNFHPAWGNSDEELQSIFDSTPGGIDQKLAAVAAAGPGYVGAAQWAQSRGIDVTNSGIGRMATQAQQDASSKSFGNFMSPLIKTGVAAGGAILGGLAAAPMFGAGAGAAGAGGLEAALGMGATPGISGVGGAGVVGGMGAGSALGAIGAGGALGALSGGSSPSEIGMGGMESSGSTLGPSEIGPGVGAVGTASPTAGLSAVGADAAGGGAVSSGGMSGLGAAGAGAAGGGLLNNLLGGATGQQGSYQFPYGDVLGAGLGFLGATQQGNTLKDMMQMSIESDLFRPQQGRYFEPLYQAATQGIGNTPYGQSIASDVARQQASMGNNMSGNQMHAVAQGLNSATNQYIGAVGPLAMGKPIDSRAIGALGTEMSKSVGNQYNALGSAGGSILGGQQPNFGQLLAGAPASNQGLMNSLFGTL